MKGARTIPVLAVAAVLFCRGSWAQDPAPPAPSAPPAPLHPRPEPVTKLTVYPVAVSRPAVRYKLLPEFAEQEPGNGATLYLVGGQLGPDAKTAGDLLIKLSDALQVPPERLTREQVQKLLGPFSGRLRYAHLAARRQYARWDPALREEGINALLPYLNHMREYANLWALESRSRIGRHDWGGAADTLQDAFSMARQLNDQPVLVQSLVSTGVTDLMLEDGVAAWVSQPGAPNLYWSLSRLPQPFIDLRTVEQVERSILYDTFPGLREALKGPVAPERWREVVRQLPRLSRQGYSTNPDVDHLNIEAALLAARTYPPARDYLVSNGMTREQVDAMTVDEAVGTYFLRQYQAFSDEAWKAWELPYWQGTDTMTRAVAEIEEAQRTTNNPLLQVVPSLDRARQQFARIDRECAMLRGVEALRDYAAGHDGAPPDRLDQVTELPIPSDPVFGRPFVYERHGQAVVIDAPAPQGRPVSDGKRYELTFAK